MYMHCTLLKRSKFGLLQVLCGRLSFLSGVGRSFDMVVWCLIIVCWFICLFVYLRLFQSYCVLSCLIRFRFERAC